MDAAIENRKGEAGLHKPLLFLTLIFGVLTSTPVAAARCDGVSLAGELLTITRQSDLRIVFNPARLQGRCVSGFQRTGGGLSDLRRLAAISGLEVVSLGDGMFALSMAAPTDRSQVRDVNTSSVMPSVPTELPEIVVIAPSNTPDVSGLWLERFSTQTIETISSEQIASLPTASVAEALRLVPGLQLDTQRGLGLHVTARGLDSPFHLVQVNGRSLALNELVENGGPRGRSFRFETLPAEFVSDITVKKTGAATDQSSAVGVTIDLQTVRPLSLKNGSAISLHVSDNSLSEGLGSGVTGSVNGVSGDGNFGIVMSTLIKNRSVRNDRFMQFQWTRGHFDDVLGSEVYAPGRVRPTIELEDRRQQALSITFQSRPASGHLTEVDLLANRLEVEYEEFGLDIYPDAAGARFIAGSQRIIGDTVVAGQIEDVRWLASRETSLNRHDLFFAGLKHSYVSDTWTMVGDLAWSRAVSGHPEGRGTSRSRLAFYAPLIFDFSGGYRVLPRLDTPTDYSNPDTYSGWTYGYAPKRSIDTDSAARLDFERHIDGPFNTMRVGAFIQRRTRDYDRRDWFLRELAGTPLSDLGEGFYQALPFNDFLSGVDGDGPRTWLVPTPDAYHAALFTSAVSSAPRTVLDMAASYGVQEDVRAIYAEMQGGAMVWSVPIDGAFGLRKSWTRQGSQGHVNDGAEGFPVRFDYRYEDLLPSLNVKAELRHNLIARVSAARTMTPANLTDVAPRLTASLDNGLASGGNPQLEPYKADALDLGLEWYPSPSQVVSATLFRKRLNQFTTSQDRQIELAGRTVELSTTINGGEATIAGLEIAVRGYVPLPDIVAGRLTIGANYTFTAADSSFHAGEREIVDQLVGLSRSSVTLTAGYEKQGVSANVGWFWRDRYLNSYGSTTVGEEYVAPLGLLDAQIVWPISPNLSLAVEGSNLTGARKYLYGVTEVQAKEINDFGKTVQVTLRWRSGP